MLPFQRLDEIWLVLWSIFWLEPASSQAPPAYTLLSKMRMHSSGIADAFACVSCCPANARAWAAPIVFAHKACRCSAETSGLLQATVCAHSLMYSSCASSFCELQPRHVFLLRNERTLEWKPMQRNKGNTEEMARS